MPGVDNIRTVTRSVSAFINYLNLCAFTKTPESGGRKEKQNGIITLSKMNIEELSSSNIEALIELVLELWPDCEFEEEYEHYKKSIGSKNERCYLAKEQEHYIGFIELSIRHDYVECAEELPVGYVEGIYVKPEFQKKGIARKLITAGENWAKQKGIKQIASDTDIANFPSIDFHRKIGFSEVGRSCVSLRTFNRNQSRKAFGNID